MTAYQELLILTRAYLRCAEYWRTRNRDHAKFCLERAKDYRWQALALDP